MSLWSILITQADRAFKNTRQILSLLYSKAPKASVTHEVDFSETDAEMDFGVRDVNEDQCLWREGEEAGTGRGRN